MFKISKELKGSSLSVNFEGALEENVSFAGLVDPTIKNMEINCKGITRINSIGIKLWIEFFSSCASKHITLKFLECSPSIVQQLNSISNFKCNGSVESIQVPFSCEKCNVEFQQLFKVDDLISSKFVLPGYKCPRCQGQMNFDDEYSEYFGCFGYQEG